MSTSNGAGVSQNSRPHYIETLPPAAAPPGFTRITLDDQNTYLVPKYLVPALFLQISKQTETEDGDDVNPGPREMTDTYYDEVGHPSGIVDMPPDPQLTGREALQLHIEIEALMEREGMSYPVAARQLYYAEVAKLEAETIASRAFEAFRQQLNGRATAQKE